MTHVTRAEGWLFREIADYMDVALQTVNDWLNDPDGSKLRARKDSYRGTCQDCGAPTDGSNGPDSAPTRCNHCNGLRRAEQNRKDWEPHRRAVEAAWAAGLTCAEMCERFGWSNRVAISVLRQRGYNLPHRRTPEQVARMAAGWERVRARKVAA